MKRASAILAEDHPVVLGQLRALLEKEFQVVATVGDGFGMIGAWLVLKPDIVIADLTMPGLDGLAAARWLLKFDASARIVFVTVHAEAEMVQTVMDLGVMGYVVKLLAGEELLPAVRAVLRGDHYLSAMRANSPSAGSGKPPHS
jgi:DNA-binding NarL/FixJ family response regulator